MPPSEKPGKKPASSNVLPGEFGMVLGVNHRDVIEACQRGDDEAFRVLFETHKDRVYSIALRYSGNSTAAMDIAQDTFVKLLSNIGQFRGDSSFESWVPAGGEHLPGLSPQAEAILAPAGGWAGRGPGCLPGA